MPEYRPPARIGRTLIDILIVVTLLVLLAALVGPRIVGRMSQADRAPTKVPSSIR
jgi:type II secretory pathway pseudopilin PulG